jgi:hypothetical protein
MKHSYFQLLTKKGARTLSNTKQKKKDGENMKEKETTR